MNLICHLSFFLQHFFSFFKLQANLKTFCFILHHIERFINNLFKYPEKRLALDHTKRNMVINVNFCEKNLTKVEKFFGSSRPVFSIAFEIDIGSWEKDTGEAKHFAGNLTELKLALQLDKLLQDATTKSLFCTPCRPPLLLLPMTRVWNTAGVVSNVVPYSNHRHVFRCTGSLQKM